MSDIMSEIISNQPAYNYVLYMHFILTQHCFVATCLLNDLSDMWQYNLCTVRIKSLNL